MTKLWKTSNVIVLVVQLLICGLGTFYKHISFGLGLGDMFGYAILYLGTVIHLALTLTSRENGSQRHAFLTFIFLTLAILIVLKATIWRGPEYRWNGSLFYLPCATRITIDNEEVQEEKLITMCSMDYYSTFSGIWTGQVISIDESEIKIPEELEAFLQRPIT